MAIKISDDLKSSLPSTAWGKILAATPVVMAVVATMLAGLASSEMTRAQYDRSLAAQQQSKAGDQWAFFQAKRLRGATQRNTFDLLQATTEPRALDLPALRQSAAQLPGQLDLAAAQVAEARQRPGGGGPDAAQAAAPQGEATEQYLREAPKRRAEAEAVRSAPLAALDATDAAPTLDALQRGEPPSIGADPTLEPKLKAALDAVESSRPEEEITPFVARLDDQALSQALRAAKERAQAFDAATKPFIQTIDRIEKLLARQTALLQEAKAALLRVGVAPKLTPSLANEFLAVRVRYTAARYDAEARLNQAIANLYELQVRRSNLAAERRHNRSQHFFYGMLAAQAGVIISTFAIAARKRNLLWSLAAAAGLVAVLFGLYVYLTV